jgi:hypothetical protein
MWEIRISPTIMYAGSVTLTTKKAAHEEGAYISAGRT